MEKSFVDKERALLLWILLDLIRILVTALIQHLLAHLQQVHKIQCAFQMICMKSSSQSQTFSYLTRYGCITYHLPPENEPFHKLCGDKGTRYNPCIKFYLSFLGLDFN